MDAKARSERKDENDSAAEAPLDTAADDYDTVDVDVRVGEPPGLYQFEPLSSRVIAAAIAVHKQLGPGFREELYENALRIELDKRGLRYGHQVDVPVHYDGILVGTHTLDLLVEGSLVVELKSVATLLEVHYAQLKAYLRAADVRVGLLLNFADYPLTIKRLVNRHAW